MADISVFFVFWKNLFSIFLTLLFLYGANNYRILWLQLAFYTYLHRRGIIDVVKMRMNESALHLPANQQTRSIFFFVSSYFGCWALLRFATFPLIMTRIVAIASLRRRFEMENEMWFSAKTFHYRNWSAIEYVEA